MRAHILRVDGVVGAHDLLAWTTTPGLPVLSAHVVVSDGALAAGHDGRVLDTLCACSGDHFDTAHCTFQLEPAGTGAPSRRRCTTEARPLLPCW